MDWTEFDERRVTGFKTVRRGYDPSEVDRFLEDVSDWLQTDAAEELGDRVVERKVETAGLSTARVLLIAEQEAQELRRKTEEECADLRAEADAAANEAAARIVEIAEQQAEELRRHLRAKAEEEAERMIDDAREQARAALLEETERKRAEVDAIVDQLERSRSAAVEKVERLRAELLSAIAKDSPRNAPTEGDRGTGQRRHAPTYGG
jgi:DivIVA domain-containing protein